MFPSPESIYVCVYVCMYACMYVYSNTSLSPSPESTYSSPLAVPDYYCMCVYICIYIDVPIS